jgi:hypothetical protein
MSDIWHKFTDFTANISLGHGNAWFMALIGRYFGGIFQKQFDAEWQRTRGQGGDR